MTEPPLSEAPLSDREQWRSRVRARNRVFGLLMGGLAVLFFAITIVKLGLQGQGG